MITDLELVGAVNWWAKAGYRFDRQPDNLEDLFTQVERQHQELVASGYSRAHYAPDDPRFALHDVNPFHNIRNQAK